VINCIFAAIPLSPPLPIMSCHCEERSDEATKSGFSVIQFEVPVFLISEDLAVKKMLINTK
jgi:hypothetical protein